MSTNTITLADRVWLAYWSLPRTGKRGKPPAYASLEAAAGLPNGIISKLVNGDRQTAAPETLEALAKALRVEPAWLAWGKGTAPTPSGELPPRTLATAPQEEEEAVGVEAGPSAVAPAVRDAVREAVEKALAEAPADAGPHEVLALARMHVGQGTSRK